MISLNAPYPHYTQRRPQPGDRYVGSGLVKGVMCGADVVLDMPVRGQKRRRSSQLECVPLEVGRLEGSFIKLLLVLKGSLHRTHYQSFMTRPLRLVLRLRPASRRVFLRRVFYPCVSFKPPRMQSSVLAKNIG